MRSPSQSTALQIPCLETARLTLRGHALDDVPDCTAMWGSPEVVRYIGGTPFTPEEVWTKVLRYVGHWALLGFGYWVVVERASGRFVGEVGLAEFRREVTPSLAGAPEAGWALAPWAHGQGYATEAVQAALGWHEATFGRGRTVCMIDPANAPSLAVAARCRYAELARTTYHGAPTVLFERLPAPT